MLDQSTVDKIRQILACVEANIAFLDKKFSQEISFNQENWKKRCSMMTLKNSIQDFLTENYPLDDRRNTIFYESFDQFENMGIGVKG